MEYIQVKQITYKSSHNLLSCAFVNPLQQLCLFHAMIHPLLAWLRIKQLLFTVCIASWSQSGATHQDLSHTGMTLFSIQVTCREYEVQLAAADPTAEAQQQRVRQLYHRQLLVPLADAAPTLQAYREWEASLQGDAHPVQVPDHVEQGFKKAQQAVSLRSEHEAMVAPDKPADENLLAAFLAYIKYEEVGICQCEQGDVIAVHELDPKSVWS